MPGSTADCFDSWQEVNVKTVNPCRRYFSKKVKIKLECFINNTLMKLSRTTLLL